MNDDKLDFYRDGKNPFAYTKEQLDAMRRVVRESEVLDERLGRGLVTNDDPIEAPWMDHPPLLSDGPDEVEQGSAAVVVGRRLDGIQQAALVQGEGRVVPAVVVDAASDEMVVTVPDGVEGCARVWVSGLHGEALSPFEIRITVPRKGP
jgi:hypothetical protein